MTLCLKAMVIIGIYTYIHKQEHTPKSFYIQIFRNKCKITYPKSNIIKKEVTLDNYLIKAVTYDC